MFSYDLLEVLVENLFSNLKLILEVLKIFIMLVKMGSVCILNDISFFWFFVKLFVCLRILNLVIFVVLWVLYLCIMRVVFRFNLDIDFIVFS